MNKVFLIGNLTRDPDLRRTNSGLAVCSFTVAVNRPKNKDGVAQADYISVQTWRTTAEICAKYLAKGRKVAILGELRTRSYDKDGRKVYVTEVVANDVEFLTPRDQRSDTGYTAAEDNTSSTDEQGFIPVDDDELPF